MEYGGVFVCDPDVDDAYARAEPPTHDDWVPDQLSGREKRYVNVGFRRIRETLDQFVGPPQLAAASEDQLPLGLFADQLATLMPSESGPGAALPATPTDTGGTRRSGPGGNARRRRATIETLEETLVAYDDMPAAKITFRVRAAQGSPETRVRLTAGVAVMDGDRTETDPPLNAETPRVAEWRNSSGQRVEADAGVTIPTTDNNAWSVIVRGAPDLTLRIDLHAESAPPGAQA